MTTIMQPFHCDLQPQIPKHPTTMHTQAHPKQLEATVTMRQKKGKPTAAATAAYRRYLSSPAAATLHRKIQGFVLPPNTSPMQHSCSHYNAVCTSLHQGQSLCDVLLCDVKSHTALHQCQFFCDVLLCSVKSHTALHQGQSFCDVSLFSVKSHTTLHQGLFFCDVLLCRVKSHTCIVMWCQVAHRPSSRSSLL